jgi:hypothetical protein
MTDNEAKTLLKCSEIAPDDLTVNKKDWKLEGTYLTRKEALGSADYLDSFKLFKYRRGYALYERNYY